MTKKLCEQEINGKIKMLNVGLLGLRLLPDDSQFDFPVKITSSVITGHVNLHVYLPYDIKALRQYRKTMGKGWKMDGKWTTTQHNGCVTHHNDFYLPNLSPNGKEWLNPFRVSLTMDTAMDRSVCHIEQDGTKEVPVWKVVCE